MGFTPVYGWAEYQLEKDLEPNHDTNVNSDGLNLLKSFRFRCQHHVDWIEGIFFSTPASTPARIPKKAPNFDKFMLELLTIV